MLKDQLKTLLGQVTISAWRLLLRTPEVYATVPMIRGVWGRALKHLSSQLYDEIFCGSLGDTKNLPRYVMRPAPPDLATAPALDWILLNVKEHREAMLWRAWDIASGMGLGPQRIPFGIRERIVLTPDNLPSGWGSWTLNEVGWPIPGDPGTTPVTLRFEVPLRLMRKSKLVSQPVFTDIIVACFRRIAGFAGLPRGETYRDLFRSVIQEADGIVAHKWVGERCDLVRWSGAQQRAIELFGVTGAVTLSKGPGMLWPLLAAAQWIHLGKGTVYGMGDMHIMPYTNEGDSSTLSGSHKADQNTP